MTEALIVCISFISTSEDSIASRAQKGRFFRKKMFLIYNARKKNQSTYKKTMLTTASGSTKEAYSTDGCPYQQQIHKMIRPHSLPKKCDDKDHII